MPQISQVVGNDEADVLAGVGKTKVRKVAGVQATEAVRAKSLEDGAARPTGRDASLDNSGRSTPSNEKLEQRTSTSAAESHVGRGDSFTSVAFEGCHIKFYLGPQSRVRSLAVVLDRRRARLSPLDRLGPGIRFRALEHLVGHHGEEAGPKDIAHDVRPGGCVEWRHHVAAPILTWIRSSHRWLTVAARLRRGGLAEEAGRYGLFMRVLVTGGAGFIGSHIVHRLSTSHEVICLDDLSTGDRSNLVGCEVTMIEGSVLDEEALAEATAGVDAIVHLAARPSVPRSIADPAASHDANATGTLRVLEAARRLVDPVVIVASSSSVYGANPVLPKHEDLAVMPMSPYAVSKLATEQYALAWQHSFGMRTLAFRFFNVFGPRQAPDHSYAAAIPSFIAAAMRGEPLTINGDGGQTRDFTSVDTLVEVIETAVSDRLSHDRPINLAFGTRTSLLEVVSLLETILGRPLERRHVAARSGDVVHSQADNSMLRSMFPRVEPRPLEAALRDTVAWMDSYLSLDDPLSVEVASHDR